MNTSSAWAAPSCQASGGCGRIPCFRIQLPAGPAPGRAVLACGAHLGEVARDLAAWARGRGLTAGRITVVAIDRRRPGLPNGAEPGRPGVVVGSFPLFSPGGLAPRAAYRP